MKFYYSLADYNAIDKADFDGRNVVVNIQLARTGAIVLLDQYKTLHFVPYSAYIAGGYANYEKVGVVRIGVDHPSFRGQIAVMNKEFPSKKMSDIYQFRLTGYTLDGTDRSGVLSVREISDKWAANHDYVVNYNATTVEGLAVQLNEYFKANEPFKAQKWQAVVSESGDIDLMLYYTNYSQIYGTGKSGFALSANTYHEWIATSAMYRKNGQRSGDGTITNMSRALAYFRNDNTSGSYNPATDVTSVKRNYPICLPGYLGTSQHRSDDHCAFLRGVYGEGEEGWLKFMKSFLPVKPCYYGTFDKETYGDAKKNTYYLASVKYVDVDGETKPGSPAADYAATREYDHELLKLGEWVLPDSDLLFDVVGGIEYGTTNNRNADVINRSLLAIGSSSLSNSSSVWSCSRCGANFCWCAVGVYGCAYGGGLYYSYLVVPLVLLDVPQGAPLEF